MEDQPFVFEDLEQWSGIDPGHVHDGVDAPGRHRDEPDRAPPGIQRLTGGEGLEVDRHLPLALEALGEACQTPLIGNYFVFFSSPYSRR